MPKRTFQKSASSTEGAAAEIRRMPANTWPNRCPVCHGAMAFATQAGQTVRACQSTTCGHIVRASDILEPPKRRAA